MIEDYRFVERNGERVFACLHVPPHAPRQAVVICHPLGEEKLWSHRVLVSFAREISAAGVLAVRFDFRGEGDSDREFQDSDLESRVEDARRVVQFTRELHPSVSEVTLLGLRFGACVAARAAGCCDGISRLVLWDPVTDGDAYMQSVLRLNLMYQMAQFRKVLENREALVARLAQGGTVNIEGYELAEPLFRQCSEFRLSATLAEFSGDVLAVQVSQGETPPKPELTSLAEALPRFRTERVQEESFWKEIKALYQRAPELTRVTMSALGLNSAPNATAANQG